MPSQHAVLSPSASERWLGCPASVRVAEQVPKPPESPYAHEGTLAHALAEIEASYHFGKITLEERDLAYEAWRASAGLDVDTIGEMAAHVRSYIELIEERLSLFPMSQVMFEQRMDTGVEKCWGTSDTVIVSPQHVEIVDFKYGVGVRVEARGNSQLRLYGCGALDTFGDLLGDTELIRITVHQPRLDHVDTEELSPEELRAWREEVVKPAAAAALHDPDAPFGPSEQACRWCPAAGECLVRIERMAAIDFATEPDVADAEQLAEALTLVPQVLSWAEAVKAAGLRRAYSEGEQLPGFKVVASGGRRVVSDVSGAIDALRREQFEPAQFLAPSKLKGVGDLEKLLNGRTRFAEVLGPYVQKTEGSPALVPESDRRSAISPAGQAAADFQEEA